MAIRKVGPAAAVTTAATTVLGTISLGAPYGRVLGFRASCWASAAKAAEGTDAAQKIQLTDADGRIVFLDASDRDYGATSGPTPSTDGTNVFFGQDETATGLSDLHVDGTGAALSSQAGQKGAICKSPVTVTVLDAGTATDYVEVSLYVEV